MLVLSALQILAAGVGLFLPGVYEGLVPAHYIAESRGQDLVTLFVAVPLLLWSLRGLRRGSLAGAMLSAGALLYVAYVSIIYAYGGVSNELYFVYVAGLGLAVFGTWRVWSGAGSQALAAEDLARLPRRSVALFLWVLSALLVAIWGGLGAAAIGAGEPSEANTILVTDLALVIPAFVLTGVWLWRRSPRGVVLAGSMLVFNVVLNGSIVAGQCMRVVHGIEPSWGLAAMFATFAAGAAALAVWFFASLPPLPTGTPPAAAGSGCRPRTRR